MSSSYTQQMSQISTKPKSGSINGKGQPITKKSLSAVRVMAHWALQCLILVLHWTDVGGDSNRNSRFGRFVGSCHFGCSRMPKKPPDNTGILVGNSPT